MSGKLLKTRHFTQRTDGYRFPFERALDFANKEKITELLYPLLVHNIGALLYHLTIRIRQRVRSWLLMALQTSLGQFEGLTEPFN